MRQTPILLGSWTRRLVASQCAARLYRCLRRIANAPGFLPALGRVACALGHLCRSNQEEPGFSWPGSKAWPALLRGSPA